ncbi:MAG: hypothetical protein WDN06_07535 [Asticcacaulis sp.]
MVRHRRSRRRSDLPNRARLRPDLTPKSCWAGSRASASRHLTAEDIVRHELVARIVRAYDNESKS